MNKDVYLAFSGITITQYFDRFSLADIHHTFRSKTHDNSSYHQTYSKRWLTGPVCSQHTEKEQTEKWDIA